jgi:hypothetical protein
MPESRGRGSVFAGTLRRYSFAEPPGMVLLLLHRTFEQIEQ